MQEITLGTDLAPRAAAHQVRDTLRANAHA